MDNPKSHKFVKRMITPLTVWALTKVLEARPVKKKLQEVDARTYIARQNAARKLRRAGRHATKNRAWLAAGAAAVAVGFGLMAKATTKPK